jgi:Cu+-exporting ATPase
MSSPANPATIELELNIEGMNCGGCAARIQRDICTIDGVDQADVNFANGKLTARLKPGVIEAVKQAIVSMGYRIHDTAVPISLLISGMHCANCANKIEQKVAQLAGVTDVQVSYAGDSLRARAEPSRLPAIHAIIEELGYHSFESSSARKKADYEHKRQLLVAEEHRLLRNFFIGALCTLPLIINMAAMLAGSATLPHWLEFALATPVQLFLGSHFYRGAWRALKSGYANMDVLVALGTSAAYLLSLYNWLVANNGELYFESSAVVITLVYLGKWLESRTKRQTTSAVETLIDLAPQQATVKRDNSLHTVAVEQLLVGDIVLIRPGEKVPADALLVNGHSELDESLLTGESLPVTRAAGDKLIAGAINGSGALEARVIAVGENSTLAKIVQWVEQAQASKAPIQRLVDRVSLYFVPCVIAIAVLTLLYWGLVPGLWSKGILSAAAVLVIACPCALGLATPAAIMAGNGIAARHGILFRDVDALQQAVKVDAVIFDKTGTLTEGKPVLSDIHFFSTDAEASLSQLYGLQLQSEHPLAKAVVHYAENRALEPAAVTSVQAIVGRGIEATAGDRQLLAGSQRFVDERGIEVSAEAAAIYQRFCARGATVMWFCVDNAPRAIYAIEDKIRDTAAAAVSRLQARQIDTRMITGDQQSVAGRVAGELGLEQYTAEAKPEDKAIAVAALQCQDKHVAMVGDGINDAPALARADIGIAMGSGTDVAAQTAGITLMRSDPLLVNDSLDIAARTYSKIKQNLWWAFLFNSAGIPLAAAGLLNPMIAGAAMAFSSVLVVSNALLLQRWRPPPP